MSILKYIQDMEVLKNTHLQTFQSFGMLGSARRAAQGFLHKGYAASES